MFKFLDKVSISFYKILLAMKCKPGIRIRVMDQIMDVGFSCVMVYQPVGNYHQKFKSNFKKI